jgi:hypothetical protein
LKITRGQNYNYSLTKNVLGSMATSSGPKMSKKPARQFQKISANGSGVFSKTDCLSE